MKNRKLLTAAALLAALTLASCGKTIDLEGYAWNGTVSGTDSDGDRVTLTVSMLCTSDKAGTLFLGDNYEGEPLEDGFALPFTYTWDDNQGIVTATYINPEENGVGTLTLSLPVSYTKTEGLRLDLRNLYKKGLVPLDVIDFGLAKTEIYKTGSLKETKWQMEFENRGGLVKANSAYFLYFQSATRGEMHLTQGGFVGPISWDVTYSYADGVGAATLTGSGIAEGDAFDAYFYLPDSQHLVFCDGESYMTMQRVTTQPEPNKRYRSTKRPSRGL